MTYQEFSYKVKRKIHWFLIERNWTLMSYKRYCCKYKSYWHMLMHGNKEICDNTNYFFTARPNPGAGIGHQIANWIAGYWFAQQFGVKFCHIPFSNIKAPFQANNWDDFLGFSKDEIKAADLKIQGYQYVYLPSFHEGVKEELDIIKSIIGSYSGKKVVFVAEQDQYLTNQYLIAEKLQNKFYSLHNRKSTSLLYQPEKLNIAIHVRRGDIADINTRKDPGISKRWQDNSYFVNVLRNTIKLVSNSKKPIHIYLFSQGLEKDFQEFMEFENLTMCLDMGAMDSFFHMVFADVLITSKSSFSYKPALLNRGIKVSPAEFWHGYPDQNEWYLADDEGNIL